MITDRCFVHPESKKTRHPTHVDNFANIVPSLAVKKFENRLIFPKVIDTSRVSVFLTHTVVVVVVVAVVAVVVVAAAAAVVALSS